MDGVLVDSEPVHFDSTVRIMSECGCPFTEADNREFIGSTDRVMFDILCKRHGLREPIEDLIARRKAFYLELIQNGRLIWRDGMRELVHDLSAQGHKLAVASSGLTRIIEYTLTRGEIRHRFHVVVSADEVPAPKPSPEIYLEAARRLGIDPSDCAAIEDTEVGVRAAKNAGMYAIAFPTETTAEMDFSTADVIVGSADEIRAILTP
jgi:HAD superfamily hydrolase (TIGR01509 family)